MLISLWCSLFFGYIVMTTVIELVTSKSVINIVLKGSGDAKIDWGDGTSDGYELSGEIYEVNHTYTSRAIKRKIMIVGNGISYLFCNNNELTSLVGKSDLTSFVGKNELPRLIDDDQLTGLVRPRNLFVLSCGDNQLTSLDVSGFSDIISLDCRNNQLSGEALDVLFVSLPKLPLNLGIRGELLIVGNPGTKNCTIGVATEKGWTVDYDPNRVLSLASSKRDVLFSLEGRGPIFVDWGDGTSDKYSLPTKCPHSYKYIIRPIDELYPIEKW
jgi:hypothetical protein